MWYALMVTFWFAAAGGGDGLPDFSGTWSLDRELTDPKAEGPEVLLVIAHAPDSLTIDRRGPLDVSTTLYFDGRRAKTVKADGQVLHATLDYGASSATVSWRGTQLIIEGRTPAPGPDALPTSLREVWRLDPQGLLVIQKEFDKGNVVYRMTEVFRRVAE